MFVAPAAVATPEAVETLITRWGGTTTGTENATVSYSFQSYAHC